MRCCRRRWSGWAAWLGVVALGLNALVPVHLAFDLAEALQPPQHAASHDVDREILGFLCGHEEGGDRDHHGTHGHVHCPVCLAVSTLAALTLPIGIALPVPATTAVASAAAAIAERPYSIPAAAYQSRAPPSA